MDQGSQSDGISRSPLWSIDEAPSASAAAAAAASAAASAFGSLASMLAVNPMALAPANAHGLRPSASNGARSTKRSSTLDDSPLKTIKRVLVAAGLPADIAAGYADLIQKEFAGEMVYFALSAWVDRPARDAAIRDERRAGRSLGWIAATYCLSRVRVHQIVNDR